MGRLWQTGESMTLQKVTTIHLYPTAVMGNADLVLPDLGVFQEKSETCILT